jgi:hypothetical protein
MVRSYASGAGQVSVRAEEALPGRREVSGDKSICFGFPQELHVPQKVTPLVS